MGRAPCCSKVGLHRGPWTTKEDSLLTNYIKSHGEGHWRSLPKQAGLLRCGKSCRLRWMNYLRPDIKRGNITDQEDDLIIRLHSLLGNRWSLIAGRLPGRTDNEIKNYWNTRLSKKIPVQPTSSYSQPKKITKPAKKQCETPASKLTSEVEIEMKLHEVHKPKPVRLGSVRNMSGLVLTSESNNNNNNNNVVESSSFSTGENYMSNNYKDGSEEEVDDVFLADDNNGGDAAWTGGGDVYNGSYGDGVEAYDNIGVWEKLYEEYLQLTNNVTGCQVEWHEEESLFI
ncbi:unnamed protein product [Rhodiola kirilowii]